MLVSLYPEITNITDGQVIELSQVLADIQSGVWRAPVEAVRAATTKTEQRALKGTLPYFTASGVFTTRTIAGLQQHSGVIALDIDANIHPGGDLVAKRAAVECDPFTYACATSAGGAGFFVLVRIPGDNHVGSFRSLAAYFAATHGLVVDNLCDVTRPRFVSYDSALYLNERAMLFEESLPELTKQPSAAPVLATILPTSN